MDVLVPMPSQDWSCGSLYVHAGVHASFELGPMEKEL